MTYDELVRRHATFQLTNNTLALVRRERIAQDAQHGAGDLPNGTGPVFWQMLVDARSNMAIAESMGVVSWRDVLLEEVAEALTESDPERLAKELVQVAAVAVAWREHLHRRGAAPIVVAA
ncbi:hypothetical protein [Umezawaea sp. Da 62-37]|uniref:hypothetical protein n=1 Tax=Umezawaea sp. Da 62-37 TaxID=3075927 RepID=UPI0028F6C268|nr:hypothetical protein [Umezawaea sp. Da 62-37]WNV90336.1 hypothetical protein RM788_19260 [Umezawaea sp. Da 62-37]